MTRRTFLSSILAAAVAPAICKAEWLMKGSGVIVPSGEIVMPDIGSTFISYMSDGDGWSYLYQGLLYLGRTKDGRHWEGPHVFNNSPRVLIHYPGRSK